MDHLEKLFTEISQAVITKIWKKSCMSCWSVNLVGTWKLKDEIQKRTYPANISSVKVNNRNTKERSEIC